MNNLPDEETNEPADRGQPQLPQGREVDDLWHRSRSHLSKQFVEGRAQIRRIVDGLWLAIFSIVYCIAWCLYGVSGVDLHQTAAV
jgi:hypothetical protein